MMKLPHLTRQTMLIALPLAVLCATPQVCAADDEIAPRHWVASRTNYVSPAARHYRYGPASYGWRYRAGDDQASWTGCGVYRYWNGEQCVDARDVPPKY